MWPEAGPDASPWLVTVAFFSCSSTCSTGMSPTSNTRSYSVVLQSSLTMCSVCFRVVSERDNVVYWKPNGKINNTNVVSDYSIMFGSYANLCYLDMCTTMKAWRHVYFWYLCIWILMFLCIDVFMYLHIWNVQYVYVSRSILQECWSNTSPLMMIAFMITLGEIM